ncbi:hypothetical protein CY34DRAFT_365813 [Suillus luteus UH-Slu-Lm8-n1]|uniref:Uncharacterized protein n=1 Tax=Suillus luteus UH-Slu-Lm8-n1 TaxID=930992 RepID=A0A0D0AAR5_9AGAM|nr:hypothetical protein CY34DRAFT_365813 [Suillus luteus UH-Slu-Lm8-n1]
MTASSHYQPFFPLLSWITRFKMLVILLSISIERPSWMAACPTIRLASICGRHHWIPQCFSKSRNKYREPKPVRQRHGTISKFEYMETDGF